MPSDGGQSTSTTSKRWDSRTGCNTPATEAGGSPSAPVPDRRRINPLRWARRPAVRRRWFDFIEQAAFPQQDAIRAGALDFFQADAAGGVGLRVEVEQEHALAQGGEARSKIDSRGGFAHAAFLVGYRNDFGWHPPDLMTSAAGFQAHNAFSHQINCRESKKLAGWASGFCCPKTAVEATACRLSTGLVLDTIPICSGNGDRAVGDKALNEAVVVAASNSGCDAKSGRSA